MKWRGKEIGNPTLEQIREYVRTHNLACDPQDVFIHYSKRGFLTAKGRQIKSIEAMCDSFNGLYLSRQRKEIRETNIQADNLKTNNPIEITGYKPYAEQLKDYRWLAFRKFVLTVRGSKCEVCGAKKCLNIHHILYHPGHFAWEYNVKEVMVLCTECHKKVHNIE